MVYCVVRDEKGQRNGILCGEIGQGQRNGILCGEGWERAAYCLLCAEFGQG
jgi:hypothetical protein